MLARNAIEEEIQMVLDLEDYFQEILKKKSNPKSKFQEGIKSAFQSMLDISSTEDEKQFIIYLMNGYKKFKEKSKHFNMEELDPRY